MTQLVLTELYTAKGEIILVSPEDYRRLAKWQWRVNDGYAVRQMYAGGGRENRRFKYQRLHHLVQPPEPGRVTDHVNGHRSDNRRENLRLASVDENNKNRRQGKPSNTGFRGVHLERSSGKYIANIRSDGRTKHIGYFADPVTAALARDAAAREAHGEFAVLNFDDTSTSAAKRAALRNRGFNVDVVDAKVEGVG